MRYFETAENYRAVRHYHRSHRKWRKLFMGFFIYPLLDWLIINVSLRFDREAEPPKPTVEEGKEK